MKRRSLLVLLTAASMAMVQAAPAAAIVVEWEVRVVDAGRPVQGAIVTIAMPDGVVLDTKRTDARGIVTTQPVKGVTYKVTVKTLAGKVRTATIFINSVHHATTVDVTGTQLDPYVSIFGGATFPGSFTEVKGIQDNAGLQYSDLKLNASAVLGMKAGLFLQKPTSWHAWREWLGAELDISYTNPHIKQQAVTLSGSFGGVPIAPVTADFPGARVRVLTVAMHLVARYPGQYFQPYVAAGPAMVWARISGQDFGGNFWGSASDTSLGFQAVAGLRAYQTQDRTESVRWFGFLEGRYQRTSFSFGNNAQNSDNFVFLDVDYSPYQAVGGIGVEF